MKKISLQFSKLTALLLACLLASVNLSVLADDSKESIEADKGIAVATSSSVDEYKSYREKWAGEASPDAEIKLSPEQCVFSEADSDKISISESSVSLSGENITLSWQFSAQTAGNYLLEFTYATLAGSQNKVTYTVMLDGSIPCTELKDMVLDRPYRFDSNAYGKDGEFAADERGNTLQPEKVISEEKNIAFAKDAGGCYNEPLKLYLSTGKHELTLKFETTGLILYGIRFCNIDPIPDYKEYISSLKEKTSASSQKVTVQAEKLTLQSDPEIQTIYDKSSAATQPSSAPLMLVNAVGGTGWQNNGQWIEWNVDIPSSGFYELDLRVRQNFKYGMTVLRSISIDGKVPFKELSDVSFSYHSKWYCKTLGGENPYQIYLTKGIHTVRMEIVSGDYETVILDAGQLLSNLNALYRKVVMITGTTPDSLRDYQLEAGISGLTEMLASLQKELKALKSYVEENLIKAGSETSAISALVTQMDLFADDTEQIPFRLSSFKTNISALADWTANLKKQPLQIDYMTFRSPDVKPQAANSGFFKELWYSIKTVLCSFDNDYGSVGTIYRKNDALNVWLNLGRDQLQALKTLTDDYSGETGVQVNLSLVNSGLVEAVMAGKGPDVALFAARTDPVNLAARNTAVSLTQFSDFDTVAEQFYQTNLIPYYYNGQCYALPLTLEFPMMFVRTDIFQELGLSVPKTWNDLLAIAPVLQRKNLQAGIPSGVSTSGIYPTLLVQYGLGLYNKTATETLLSDEKAIDAFGMWTDFYSKYSFPLSYDFFNRFRSGEMPIGIAAYTVYNQLKAAAPEISGLWQIYSVPATVTENGVSDNSSVSLTSTAGMILKSENKQNAWNYLKWFSSGDIQAKFGTAVEAVLGAAGRYAPANPGALEKLPWTSSERAILKDQWKYVTEMPVIPASYIVERNLSNAFKKVVYYGKNPRETISSYNFTINQEIKWKNEQFDN